MPGWGRWVSEEDVRIISLILQTVVLPVLRTKHKAGGREEQGMRVRMESWDLRNHISILFLKNLKRDHLRHWTDNQIGSRALRVGGSLVKHSGDILVGCLGLGVFQDVQPRPEYLGRYVGLALATRRLASSASKQACRFDVFARKGENDLIVSLRVAIANDRGAQSRQRPAHLKRPRRLLEFFIRQGKVDPFFRDEERMAEDGPFHSGALDPRTDAVAGKPGHRRHFTSGISENAEGMKIFFFLEFVLS